MTLAFEIKRRARQIIGPVIGCLLLGYFIFHAVEGDRGLHAWQALDAKIEAAEIKLAALEATRESLEKKVAKLHPESIDPDLLTERARVVLNYLGRDEFVMQDLGGFALADGDAEVGSQTKTQAISIASNIN